MLSGQYFDGISAAPKEVNVEISEENIIIYDLQGREMYHTNHTPEISNYYKGRYLSISLDANASIQLKGMAADKGYNLANKSNISWYDNIALHTRPKIVAMLLGVIIMLAVGFYYLTTSETAINKIVNYLPQDLDSKLGSAVAEDSTFFGGTVTTNEALDSFFMELKYSLKDDIKLHLVEDSMVNAFAVPGGNVYLFRGIIQKMEDHTELAAVIGHESAHIHYRHSIKSLVRSMLGYSLVSMLTGDVTGASTVILQNANSIKDLQYSRGYESESDAFGLKAMCESGVDPQGMVQLFKHMSSNETEKMEGYLKYLSTHPIHKDRISAMNSIIANLNCNQDAAKNARLSILFKRIKKQ
jgi:beta-barrel assembly-enhancing protease